MRNEIAGLAVEAARVGGKVHLSLLGRTSVQYKSSPQDLITEADKLAEEAIIQTLRRRRPHDSILTEESPQEPTRSKSRWIIDPLDGTTNFAHGYPHFCISIAYEYCGRTKLGVVLDALRGECFIARRGRGARLNGKPIAVSRTSVLATSLIGTGFPYDQGTRGDFYLDFWRMLLGRVHGIRRSGSAALDLAFVAAGRLDGFWQHGLKPWDVAAGALLIEEAGGKVTNLSGSPFQIEDRSILASNGLLHPELCDALSDN